MWFVLDRDFSTISLHDPTGGRIQGLQFRGEQLTSQPLGCYPIFDIV